MNFVDITKQKLKEHSANQPQIPDYSYKVLLIIRGSESGKTNTLINLISYLPDIDKIYLYAEVPSEAKYKLLINKPECVGLKHCNNSKALFEYSLMI